MKLNKLIENKKQRNKNSLLLFIFINNLSGTVTKKIKSSICFFFIWQSSSEFVELYSSYHCHFGKHLEAPLILKKENF